MLEIFTAAFWEKYGSLLLDGTIDTLIMVVIFSFNDSKRNKKGNN